MEKQRYTATAHVAAPGTPLTLTGGTSAAGHMFYSISDGENSFSYGFAPKVHGSSSGPGEVFIEDQKDYQDPYYSRTLEISKEQYDALHQYGNSAIDENNPDFNMTYNGLDNSCIDFTWKALNSAGIRPKHIESDGPVSRISKRLEQYEGEIKPLDNIDSIKSIKAPMPDSPLNQEHFNPMPERSVLQKLLSENDKETHNLYDSPELNAMAAAAAIDDDAAFRTAWDALAQTDFAKDFEMRIEAMFQEHLQEEMLQQQLQQAQIEQQKQMQTEAKPSRGISISLS